MNDERYSSLLGIYSAGCGLNHVMMSWGHDEYFYQILEGNSGVQLPPEALYIIRYHSYWSWHFGGEYDYLLSEHDRKMLPFMKMFRECDLYSKDESNIFSPEAVRPYYEKLMKKYLPEVLQT